MKTHKVLTHSLCYRKGKLNMNLKKKFSLAIEKNFYLSLSHHDHAQNMIYMINIFPETLSIPCFHNTFRSQYLRQDRNTKQ